MKTIFDFGLYDASDTEYYLSEGFKVVAVEANPALARRAETGLKAYIDSGQLLVVNAAISTSNAKVELTICGDDLGSSSTFEESIVDRVPLGKFTVPGVTTQEIIARYGVPHYLKIDIEGADNICVKALTRETKPTYLSFEIGDSFEELLQHLATIGFSKFKLINQCSFREFSNERNLWDRIGGKAVRIFGYAEPQCVKRGDRYFKLYHSSGPAPWCSDGQWCSHQELLAKWAKAKVVKGKNVWYDLHAM